MFGSFLGKGKGKCKDDPISNSLTRNKLASDGEEVLDQGTEIGEEPVKKTINRSNVSIDVTKALLLLGFSTWSSLEPEKEKGNVAYVEDNLNKHIEAKLAERREYLDLIEETKEINYGLYLKMVQADEQRHGALFHEEKKISEPQILKEVKVEKTNQPLRRAKTTRSRRNPKKNIKLSEQPNCVATTDNKDEVVQDGEEVAMTWAYTILINEFYRRNEIRDKMKKLKKSTNEKLEALWKFRKIQALTKKENKKKEKERKEQELLKSAAISAAISAKAASKASKKDEKSENTVNEENPESNGTKKRGSFKRKVQVINLQDQIDAKKKSTGSQNGDSQEQPFYRLKTEKEKVEEAKKVLRYLKEKQELRDQIERLEGKNKSKENISRDNSTAISDQTREDTMSIETAESIEDLDQDMPSDAGSSNVSSNASSVSSSRKSSKKKYVPRMKQKVKRSTSDPANKGNLLSVPSRSAAPKSPAASRRPHTSLFRTSSAPQGATLTPPTGTRKLSKKASRNISDSRSSRISSEGSDDSSSSFSLFVKNNLQEKGLICNKEDELLIENAIKKTLLEHEMEEEGSGMILEINCAREKGEQPQQFRKSQEKYQKLRELSNFNYDNMSLDDINIAADELLFNSHEEQVDPMVARMDESTPEIVSGDSTISSENQSSSVYEEDTRDSTDTFYSVPEEPEENSEGSAGFSFEKSFHLLSTVEERVDVD